METKMFTNFCILYWKRRRTRIPITSLYRLLKAVDRQISLWWVQRLWRTLKNYHIFFFLQDIIVLQILCGVSIKTNRRYECVNVSPLRITDHQIRQLLIFWRWYGFKYCYCLVCCKFYLGARGGVVVKALRYRQVKGSIRDYVIGIFQWHNPSGRTMALGSTHPRTGISTTCTSWG
jgi:hypothetical protein